MLDFWILAAANLGQAFNHYSRRSSSPSNNWFIIAVIVAIGLLWGGLHYWDRIRKRFEGNNAHPNSLFLELCHAHNLTRAERGLLEKVAESQQLKQPARIFIDPFVLKRMAKSRGPQAKSYLELSQKLFGSPGSSPGEGTEEVSADSEQTLADSTV